MRYEIVTLCAFATLSVPVEARGDGPQFGGRGQVVLSDDQPIGLILANGGLAAPEVPGSQSTVSLQVAALDNNGGSGSAFVVAPAFDAFAIDNFSLGGNLLVGLINPPHGNTGSGQTITVFGIAPRVGYNFPISDVISFWPKIFFGFAEASANNSGGSSNTTAIGAYAPFLFHVVPHFFIGIGPNFSTQLSSTVSQPNPRPGVSSTNTNINSDRPKVTQVGIQFTFGGWFGEARKRSEPTEKSEPAPTD